MVKTYISEEYEFYEVLNAFPVLESTLEKLDIKQDWVVEGKSIESILSTQGFSQDEIHTLVRRFNHSIDTFLKSSQRVYSKPQEQVHYL